MSEGDWKRACTQSRAAQTPEFRTPVLNKKGFVLLCWSEDLFVLSLL